MAVSYTHLDVYKRQKFRPQEFPGLPATITYGIDVDGSIQKQIAEGMKLSNKTDVYKRQSGDGYLGGAGGIAGG